MIFTNCDQASLHKVYLDCEFVLNSEHIVFSFQGKICHTFLLTSTKAKIYAVVLLFDFENVNPAYATKNHPYSRAQTPNNQKYFNIFLL